MDSDQEYIYSGNESSENENDEIEIESDDEGMEHSGNLSKKMEDYPFEVLGMEKITEVMFNSITEVNDILNIQNTAIRSLLNHFNWNKEKLLEKYYDGNQKALFKAAHVMSSLGLNRKRSRRESKRPRGIKEECEICLMKMPLSMMTGIECGHRFCPDCWSEYLTTKIMDEGMSQTITCAAHDCCILVDDQTVMKLVKDDKVKLKYRYLVTKSFVECNRLLRWCPYPDCTYAVKVQYPEAKPVVCRCKNVFCFNCGEGWHDPVNCDLLKKWIIKCNDDSETLNWIAANTKDCPKCKVSIEKDGGCNHITCSSSSCGHQFCWVCLGPWERHGQLGFSCNRYDESEGKQERDAQENARTLLKRYLFYCNRYMNHMKSLKFEHRLYERVEKIMQEMQEQNISYIEVQFLKKAVDILCKCRQTLQYTYVFVYYLKKNNQSAIFEDNQNDLESSTEMLSEYLDRDLTSENFAVFKQEVQDKCRYCDQRRRKLLDHVHEGCNNDSWEYLKESK